MNWIIFVSLAALGAAARWGLSGLGQRFFSASLIPVGTLVANAAGALIIGWLYSLHTQGKLALPSSLYVIVVIAFLGSLTTFSSFTLDTVKLFQQGFWLWAGVNVLLTNTVCLGFCYIGVRVGYAT